MLQGFIPHVFHLITKNNELMFHLNPILLLFYLHYHTYTFILWFLRHVNRFILGVFISIIIFFKKLKKKYRIKDLISNSWLLIQILIQSLGDIILILSRSFPRFFIITFYSFSIVLSKWFYSIFIIIIKFCH